MRLDAGGKPTGKMVQRYYAFGQEVCRDVFLSIYPISSSTLDRSELRATQSFSRCACIPSHCVALISPSQY